MSKLIKEINDADNESIIWTGSPSQWVNFSYYFLSIILLPITGFYIESYSCQFGLIDCNSHLIIAVFLVTGFTLFFLRFLITSCHVYEISDQRIIEKTGVFSRKSDEMELYRVKDIRHDQPFSLRIFSRSNIILQTSDHSNPLLTIKGIKDGKKLKEQLRRAVDIRRDIKYVREIGVN